MYLGIEIGGTKLQLGVGAGDDGRLAELQTLPVDADRGAAGILAQIERAGRRLIDSHPVARIGIGFGGPVDAAAGRVFTSHQVAGWDNFPLVQWCREKFGLPAVLGNDCDAAALAEARFGAGRGRRTVFYVTVGTGIGGGLVIDGRLQGTGRPAAAEIGHLRPSLDAIDRSQTVEAIASGRGIEQRVKSIVRRPELSAQTAVADLLQRCGGEVDRITAKHVAQAARDGNAIAKDAVNRAVTALGWTIAQMVTLMAPEVVVVGGGVSLMGDELFFGPLRSLARRYVFAPLADSFEILPAALGEEVVVHGAVLLAAAGS